MSNVTRLNGNGSNFRDDIIKALRNEILSGRGSFEILWNDLMNWFNPFVDEVLGDA